MEPLPPDYQLSNDTARMDVAAIHAFLSTSYWSPGVPLDVVARAVRHSVCAGIFLADAQVAFGRAVTDQATFAYLADIYVLEAHRGRGLAQRIVAALLSRPELQGLRRLMLVTRDAHRLYGKYGFTALARPERVMELHRPEIYRQAKLGHD